MALWQEFDKYFDGQTERFAVQAACVGVSVSALTMMVSNSMGTVLGFITLVPYSAYRIAQLARRPACREDKPRMVLALCIAIVTMLNLVGLGNQLKFIFVLFGIEAWLYFSKRMSTS